MNVVVVIGSVVECLRAGNMIGDDGAKAIAAALKDNKTVTTINLSGELVVCLSECCSCW